MLGLNTAAEAFPPPPPPPNAGPPITGPRTRLKGYWVGRQPVSPSLKIVVMAGHADSQGMNGAGTSGAAVDLRG
ncbi:MAG: N-acetylmuramoyl-L-alanine amidase, partial [Prochlorococcus sp.]